jgi:hypothetical protein
VTAETDLLPLPEPDYLMPQGPGWPDIPAWSENTVRQLVANATAPLQAKIEALRAEALGAVGDAMQARAELKDWRGAAETYKNRAERLAEALEEILSRSSMNLAMNPNPLELTAMLGDIHQIADAALSKENSND